MKLKQCTHFLLIKILILSLIYSPVSFAVVEQNDWALSISSGLNQGMNVLNQFQQMQQSSLQQNSLSQALQIKVRNEPLFGCPMAEAISQFPEGYCQAPLSPQDIGLSNWLGQKAAERGDFYDQLLSEVQTPPIGIQCMDQGKKLQADGFQMKINQLQAFIGQIKEEDAQFKRMLEEKKKGMKQLYGEINGQAKGSGTLGEDTNNYVEAFKQIPGCTAVMTTAKLGATGRSSGLKGVRTFMMKPAKGGMSVVDRTYAINDGSIQNDLNKQIGNLRSTIASDGVEGFSTSNYRGNGLAFKGMDRILAEKNIEIEKKKNELQSLLQDIDPGMKVPPLNKYFSERINNMEEEASRTFKDGIIESCISNPAYAGVSIQDLLKGIRKKEGGATLTVYKRELTERLNDTSMTLDEKLASIDALSAQYNKSGIYIKSGNSKYRPQELIRKLVNTCDTMYEKGTLKAGNRDTFKRKVEMATQAVSDIKAWESSFMGDIEQKLRDGLVNCSDSKMESVGGCSATNLDPASNDAFCLSSAKKCSSKINSCMANIDNMIKDRTNKLNSSANSYNVLIQQHLNKRKQQLANTAQYTFLQADWLSSFFKGSKIKVPVIGIETPAKTLDPSLQLDLFSGGDMKFLDAKSGSSLISQLNKLEKTLDRQQKEVQKQIVQKIASEKNNLLAEKSKWEKVKSDCDSAVASFDQMQSQQYAEQMQQTQENLAKADAFCRKYNRLREAGPGPGCDDDVSDLVGDMDQIATMLNPSVNSNLGQMKQMCNMVNNEQSDLEYDDDEGALDALCDSYSNQDEIMDMVRSNVALAAPGVDLDGLTSNQISEMEDLNPGQKRALNRYVDIDKKIKTYNKIDYLEKFTKKLIAATAAAAATTAAAAAKATADAIANYEIKFQKENDNICKTLEMEYIITAINDECSDGTCSKGDIDDRIIKLEDNEKEPQALQKIGSKAQGLLTAASSPSWSAFGEEPEGTCYSQAAGNRIGENQLANPFGTIPGMENMGNIWNN